MLEKTTRFTHILGRLRAAVATFVARQARGPRVVVLGDRTYVEKVEPTPHRPIATETWVLLIRRIERLSHRFRRLVERWKAGLPPYGAACPIRQANRATAGQAGLLGRSSHARPARACRANAAGSTAASPKPLRVPAT